MGLAPRFWPACRSRPGPRPRQPRASRSSRAGPPRLGPAQLRALAFLPRAAPFPCWSPRHATTAAENFRHVATTCRRRPPRGSRGLTPRPRARLHLLVPVRSLTRAHAAFPLLPSREPQAPPSPRPQLRRRRAPAPPRHSPIPRASNSASLSDTWCSRLCHRLSHGSACSKLRRRRPWRHLARPPWNVPFLPFSAMLSCLPAFSIASRTSCARSLALARPIMAAGRWPSRAVAPARAHRRVLCLRQPAGPARQSGRGPKPCQAAALPFRSGRAGRKRPWAS